MPQVREPAVAGMFYPGGRDELEAEICRCSEHEYGPRGGGGDGGGDAGDTPHIFGAICPHAGYKYSGPVACHSMAALAAELSRRGGEDGGGESERPLFIMAGPNHRGIGAATATMSHCMWRTPLGDVDVDSQAADALAAETGGMARQDAYAHSGEHSLEVQVPMLQHFVGPQASILPVLMADQSSGTAERLGHAMARVAAGAGAGMGGKGPALLIASSDLTHYEPNDAAHEKDGELVKAVLGMDVEEFYRVLRDRHVTACGYGAIAATMVACADLGATQGRLLRYATSHDVAGADESSVVGYASVVFCR